MIQRLIQLPLARSLLADIDFHRCTSNFLIGYESKETVGYVLIASGHGCLLANFGNHIRLDLLGVFITTRFF